MNVCVHRVLQETPSFNINQKNVHFRLHRNVVKEVKIEFIVILEQQEQELWLNNETQFQHSIPFTL